MASSPPSISAWAKMLTRQEETFPIKPDVPLSWAVVAMSAKTRLL